MTPDEIALEPAERAAIQAEGEPDLLAAAVAYAELGWAVFPITADRTPLAGSHGYKDATAEPRRLRSELAHPDARGLAIATAASRIVGIDIDPRNGGEATAARVLTGELPPHPVNRTRRGGWHRIFKAPVCSAIRTKADALGPGIDVEAFGHGVIFVPPTVGYRWEVSPFDVPPPYMPLWLWRLLPKLEEPTKRRCGPRGKRTIRFSVSDALEACGRLGRIKKASGGWLVICPVHDDRHNSLSIREGSDGQPLLHCFADCPFTEIVAAIERLIGRRGVA